MLAQGLTDTNLYFVLASMALALLLLGFVILIVKRYKRCPSNRILVIYGKVASGQSARCLHGGGAFVWPLIQDYAYLSLTPLTIPIPLQNALSLQNIRINVPSTFTVGVSTDPAIMNSAAERLLNLDQGEIDTWMDRVEVGNAYINRHITGAIVRRQSFGGWKASVVGPGAKAGGPNYVAQLGTWTSDGLPTRLADAADAPRRALRELLPLLQDRTERTWLRAAVGSDAYAWEHELGREIDDSDLVVETNVFRYRPYPLVWVRTAPDCRPVQLYRVVLAALAVGADVRISLDPSTSAELKALDGRDEETTTGLRTLARYVDRAETDADFVARVDRGEVTGRIRLVGRNDALARELAEEDVTLLAGEVLATGRRELLTMLREQAISRTMHRFGHLPPTHATVG